MYFDRAPPFEKRKVKSKHQIRAENAKKIPTGRIGKRASAK